ncbi:MAG: carboxypeptidase-like regulatory domain-containing protein, partial [Candidatus Jordarchaeaceae archaeon]
LPGKCPMQNKIVAIMIFAFFLWPASVEAHKLKVFATVEGQNIKGKVSLNDGEPIWDATVKVFDPTGKEIASTRTDEEGNFTIKAEFYCDYRIVADSGDGHGAEYKLSASLLPAGLPKRAATPSDRSQTATKLPQEVAGEKSHSHLSSDDQFEMLRAEIARLSEQLQRYEDRVRMTDIIGGIGYIVGLTGAAYYYLGSRRRN